MRSPLARRAVFAVVLLVLGAAPLLPVVGALGTGACAVPMPTASSDRRWGIVAEDQSHWYVQRVLSGAIYRLQPILNDVDLYVYHGDCHQVLCASVLTGVAVDECALPDPGEYRVQVYGWRASSYVLELQDNALPRPHDDLSSAASDAGNPEKRGARGHNET